jgi:hypothetical protein
MHWCQLKQKDLIFKKEESKVAEQKKTKIKESNEKRG